MRHNVPKKGKPPSNSVRNRPFPRPGTGKAYQDYARIMRSDKNSLILSRLWRKLVNPQKRMESEGPFLREQLAAHGCTTVFDSCLGMGATSVYLLQRGYGVTSNEIDAHMLGVSREYAGESRVSPNATSFDWRKLAEKFPQSFADAVLCMGNSLTYIFGRAQRLEVLRNFREILREGGILILDTRNYPRILRERERILGNPEAFREFNRYVYCGTDSVPITPVVLEDNEVVLAYTNLSLHESGYLRIYPFKGGELNGLLADSGFRKVSVFSDYRAGMDENACFHQFVCVK